MLKNSLKNTILFSCLFLGISFSAQNQRFVYDYTFVKDSLDREKTTATEAMTLDITEKGSKYYSYGVFERDSTMQAEISKQMKGSGFGASATFATADVSIKGTVKTEVNKTYPNFDVLYSEPLGINKYVVKEERKIVWKILPEKMKVGKFDAQKATTEMFGRKWTAWFSTELPFQDGPYKFHGLPGLIVKIEDDTKSHIMELQGVKTLPKDYAFPEKNGMFSRSTINLDYKKFKKAYIENRDNPSKSMRQMHSMMGSSTTGNTTSVTKMVFKDQNGKDMDMNKMMDEMDKNAKEENKKNNNLLELDLLK